MLRVLCLAALALCAAAFAPAASQLQLSKVAARSTDVSMAARKKAAPKKAKPVAGKSVKKGGIFPWITNEAGSCSEPISLSAFDFTGDDGDAFIGWGFMPNSVKALYPKGYKGMFGK